MQLVPVDHDPFADAPQPSYRLEPVDHDPFAATDPQTGDGSAAVGMGLVSGVPVVGPYLKGGLENVAAGVRALSDGSTFADAKQKVQAFDSATAAAHPIANTAGEIAGGVVGTLPLVSAAPSLFGIGAGTLGARAGASALTGGVLGGADAYTRGQDPTIGTGLGFGLGLAGPPIAAGIGKVAGAIASKLHPVEVSTVPELKAAASMAYKAADDEGVRIAQPVFSGIVNDIDTAVRDAGIDKTLHPRATAVLDRFSEMAGSAPTLSETETLRRVAKGATNSLEPDEKRIGKIILDKLDTGIGRLSPADVVSNGDPQAAVEALQSARELWARSRKAEMIGDALTKAERRADTSGTGGNVNNAMRQQIRGILDSPKKVRGFSEDERDAMERVVRGTSVENALRMVGRISPTTGALQTMAALAATAHDPKLAVAPMIGTIAKSTADATTKRNIEVLGLMLRNGGAVLPSQAAIEADAQAKRIGAMLLSQTPVVANRLR